MQENQPNFQFEWVETGDGSPSVRLWKEEQPPECMHHSGGALSESLYIYGEAFEKAMEFAPKGSPIRVLSLGLGLGYNEMIATALAEKSERTSDLYIDSFESEDFLTQSLQGWLNEQVGNADWSNVYGKILDLLSKSIDLPATKLRSALADLKIDGRWNMNGSLTEETKIEKPYSCIFFDAFSSGATPELWGEEFITELLKRATNKSCVLSTYAATGNLKRALKANGFEVELRKGFQGKRHSIWATRSLYTFTLP
jgi:tRNA U34 5-methylaminomethyl-2-thiouridine-forming methyltransferase MnmC